jgi:hypothetical protein
MDASMLISVLEEQDSKHSGQKGHSEQKGQLPDKERDKERYIADGTINIPGDGSLVQPVNISSEHRNYKETVTITFGDCAENNPGMQKIGTQADTGFELNELIQFKRKAESSGYKCSLVDLSEYMGDVADIDYSSYDTEAYFLLVRNGAEFFLGEGAADSMLERQKKFDWDKKAFMRGKVKNKRARHNLCYSSEAQVADYECYKGTIIPYSDVPLVKQLKDKLQTVLGPKANELVGEGNHYYDLKKCGIGYHGDAERRKVIALRLGATMPMHFQWFFKREQIGENFNIQVNHGDIYVMSTKTTGYDWRRSIVPTIRHAAGCKSYTLYKKKKKQKVKSKASQ